MKKFVVLGIVVVVGLGVVLAAFLYGPDLLKQQRVDSTLERMTVGSALVRAAVEIENDTRSWPKTLDEIRAAQTEALAAEPDLRLDGVEYNLIKVNGELAEYEFVFQRESRTVTATSRFGKERSPAAAEMGVGQQ